MGWLMTHKHVHAYTHKYIISTDMVVEKGHQHTRSWYMCYKYKHKVKMDMECECTSKNRASSSRNNEQKKKKKKTMWTLY